LHIAVVDEIPSSEVPVGNLREILFQDADAKKITDARIAIEVYFDSGALGLVKRRDSLEDFLAFTAIL
jgi:hypothetical protein